MKFAGDEELRDIVNTVLFVGADEVDGRRYFEGGAWCGE